MIQVRLEKKSEDITAFHIEGHSGYADRGSDIICSAVSALAINCINSMEELTDDVFSVRQEDGMLDFCLQGAPSEGAQLLLRSLALGLNGISETYGEQYVSVKIVRRNRP